MISRTNALRPSGDDTLVPKTKQITTVEDNFSASDDALYYLVTISDSDILASSFVKVYPRDTNTEEALNDYLKDGSKVMTVSVGEFSFLYSVSLSATHTLNLVYQILEVSE